VVPVRGEDAGGVVPSPGAKQRLPAAPVALPGLPRHMGGLRLLLGVQLLAEPPFPGSVALNFLHLVSLSLHVVRFPFSDLVAALLLLAARSDEHSGELKERV
jgi:hypothetical protein